MQTTVLENVKHTYQCPKKWSSIVDKNDPEFCTLCQKKVHDLTNKLPEDINQLFEQNNGTMCAKIYEDQLDTWEEPTNKWKLIAATLAAFFTFNIGKVTAQDAKKEVPTEQTDNIDFKYTPAGDAKCVLPKEQMEDFEIEDEVEDIIETTCDTKAIARKRRRYRHRKVYFSKRFPFIHKRRALRGVIAF